jgi:hypothetical protein
MVEKGELIAKAKFWFGGTSSIFKKKFIVEYNPESEFVYVYRRR